MPSLVVLMIEAEQPEGLSSRKLVVETAKHNVLSAYSKEDGLELLRRFPSVDAIFVHGALVENSPEILNSLKERAPDVPLVLAAPFGNLSSPLANFVVDSHHPQELLRLLTQEIKPRQAAVSGR